MNWIIEIIPRYLEILISWPMAISVVGLFFFMNFKEEIKDFLINMKSFKAGAFEATRQGAGDIVKNERSVPTEPVEKAEFFEFEYLKLALVQNSKFAVWWFYNYPSHSSTRENFMSSFSLPSEINTVGEKEAIFTILLSTGLIKEKGTLFEVSDKGEKFLKYINLIK